MELPNEIIYSQKQNPITEETIEVIPMILHRIEQLLLRKGYYILDPEGLYYMVLKKSSNPLYNAGVIKLIKADGIISPFKILHRRYLNSQQYDDINIPSLHTQWINIDPRDGGQGLGPLLLGYAILHLFRVNPRIYYLTLDDDSDHSGEFEKNIYIGLGFVNVDVSIANPLEVTNIAHFGPIQETRLTDPFFAQGNTQPSQPIDDADYKFGEDEDENNDEDDEDDDDYDDDDNIKFTWGQTDSQMINTIPNFINFLTAKIEKYEGLQADAEHAELEGQKNKNSKNKPPAKVHKKTKEPNANNLLRRSTRNKNVGKGINKTKRKYRTKRRVKYFKRKGRKSKLKREKLIGLAASHPHTLTNKRIY